MYYISFKSIKYNNELNLWNITESNLVKTSVVILFHELAEEGARAHQQLLSLPANCDKLVTAPTVWAY